MRVLSCGCAQPRTRGGTSVSDSTATTRSDPSSHWPPPFDQWSFRAPTTPATSHRSQPSDTSTVDSRTPLRVALPPTPASESSRWSPDSDGPAPFVQQVRRSTSKVVMYLRHRASVLFHPPAHP